MEITKGILIEGLSLFIKKQNTLIFSDIHIGYEQSLQKQGIFIPIKAYDEMMIKTEKTINKMISGKNIIKKIIINGDILHSFSKISLDEKRLLKDFMNMLRSYAEVSIIRGNHDKSLSFILPDITIYTEIILKDILITHGDSINKHSNDKNIKTIIIGHEHPAIAIGNNARAEKFKCFLKGAYKGKGLIVMPSSNMIFEGSDVLKEKLLSPYLKNVDNFEIFLIEDKVYDFGTIKSLINKMTGLSASQN